MARKKMATKLALADERPKRANRVNFFEMAYQRIEEMLVNCDLKPGVQLTLQELSLIHI